MEITKLSLIKIVCLLLFCCFLTSCEKKALYPSIEGHWKVIEIKNHKEEPQPCNNLFYSIQLNFVKLEQKDLYEKRKGLVGKMQYNTQDETLRLYDFKHATGETDNGHPATLVELSVFGLYQSDCLLKILKADGKNLVLSSDQATIHLIKF